MRVAINEEPAIFCDAWVSICKEQGVSYKVVNCSDNEIIQQIGDCDSLLWWWDAQHKPYALELTRSLELAGKVVLPSSADCWHTDDKIAQRYLFEVLGLPTPRTYTFFSKASALSWIKSAEYPKVFKLRSSFLSDNVWIIKSPSQAARFVSRAFGSGFEAARRSRAVSLRYRQFLSRRTPRSFAALVKHLLRFCGLLLPRSRVDLSERGYVCFQDYVPGMETIYRVLIVGGKAFAMRQPPRYGGVFTPSRDAHSMGRPETVPASCIDLSFKVSGLMKADILGLEMAMASGSPLIIETDPFGAIWDIFPGFWDRSLRWHETPASPAREMIAVLQERRERNLRDTNSAGRAARHMESCGTAAALDFGPHAR